MRLGDSESVLDITRDGDRLLVRFEGGNKKGHVLASAWRPGDPVWSGTFDGRPIWVQVRAALNGFDVSHRGVETARLCLHRARGRGRAADADQAGSGLRQGGALPDARARGVDRGARRAGGQGGETLAVVEAMKMENVLRAERDGVVKAIKAKPGDSLAVDAVIMEFA